MTPKGRRVEFDGEVIFVSDPTGIRIELFKGLGQTAAERELIRRIGALLVEAVGGNPNAIPARWRS